MDEEIKKKLKELEGRIDDLESQMERVIRDTKEHKHSKSDGRLTLNY
jgi:archaellum component FlaC